MTIRFYYYVPKQSITCTVKKNIHAKIPRVEGIVKSTERGFGFLEIDTQKSYFIPPKNMKKVMHGDRIIALLKIEQDREIVEPEKLIEPFLTRFVGKIEKKDNKLCAEKLHEKYLVIGNDHLLFTHFSSTISTINQSINHY